MYREGNKNDAFELEKRLSELERQAAEIIQRAIDTFATPGNILRLHRGDRDCLRKFFFLMKYRNRNLHQRYGHDSLDTYEGEDKEILANYMKRKGFKSPRDVWLANIHAFLSLEIDPYLKWIPKIQSTAYQLDAITFLEKALAKLGGPAVRSVSKVIALPEIHMSVWVALKVREELRQKRADLYEIYKMLKPVASKKTFDYDADQASRMLFLRINTDVIMNNCGMQISDKNVVKSHRQDIFTSLPIQRVWLYLKVSRNLSRFDLDDFMIQKESPVLDGPEDTVAKTIHHQQRTQRHTELMFYVGLQDQGW